jgi:hypothetical protein
MHCAVALYVEDKISEGDVRILYTADPSALHQFSREARSSIGLDYMSEEEIERIGCTPVHLLCMHKEPKLSLIRYFGLRDPKAFLLSDRSKRNTLHLVAKYSESLELLQTILQVDQTMTKGDCSYDGYERDPFTPLGLLCERSDFSRFHEMLSCLIEVDSTIEVIYNGIICCLQSSYGNFDDNDITPGSRGNMILMTLAILLKANPDVILYKDSSIFHVASTVLRGALGVAVLSFFHSKDRNGIKTFYEESLPIHNAAKYSCLDVLKFLHQAYPESLTMLTSDEDQNTLLHQAVNDNKYEEGKIQYLLEQCPTMIRMIDGFGRNPLHCACINNAMDLKRTLVIFLLNADPTLAREKCIDIDIDTIRLDSPLSGSLYIYSLTIDFIETV